MIKRLLQNKILQLSLAAVLGGVLTMLFLQETIIKKRDEESRRRLTEISQKLTETESKLVNAKRASETNRHKVIVRTKKPDGTITEIITVDSNTKVLEEIRSEEARKAEETVAARISELESHISTLSVHRNPKNLTLFAGAEVRGDRVYTFGISYNFWGPLTIGGVVNTNGSIVPLLGLRF